MAAGRSVAYHGKNGRPFRLVLPRADYCDNSAERKLYTPVMKQSKRQPRSQGSLLPVPTERERERDPGWVWSRDPRTKLIPREESFVSQFFCLVRFHRSRQGSRSDRKGKTDLLSLQL